MFTNVYYFFSNIYYIYVKALKWCSEVSCNNNKLLRKSNLSNNGHVSEYSVPVQDETWLKVMTDWHHISQLYR